MNGANFFRWMNVSHGLGTVLHTLRNTGAYFVGPFSKSHPWADLLFRIGVISGIGIVGVWAVRHFQRGRSVTLIHPPAGSPPSGRPHAQSAPASALPVVPVVPFNFTGLPEDLQVYVINLLGSPTNLRDVRCLSEVSREMLRLVFAYQEVWRRAYQAKYREDIPLIKANSHLNGREAIRFVHKIRKDGMIQRVSQESVRIGPSSQVLKLG